jgi:hypothetical protein
MEPEEIATTAATDRNDANNANAVVAKLWQEQLKPHVDRVPKEGDRRQSRCFSA